jgi:hypothetical protein
VAFMSLEFYPKYKEKLLRGFRQRSTIIHLTFEKLTEDCARKIGK